MQIRYKKYPHFKVFDQGYKCLYRMKFEDSFEHFYQYAQLNGLKQMKTDLTLEQLLLYLFKTKRNQLHQYMLSLALGYIYSDGEIVKRDENKAIQFLTLPVLHRNLDAFYLLATTYYWGKEVQDHKKAIRYLHNIAERYTCSGHTGGKFVLGLMCAEKNSVIPKYWDPLWDGLGFFSTSADGGHYASSRIMYEFVQNCPEGTLSDGWKTPEYWNQKKEENENNRLFAFDSKEKKYEDTSVSKAVLNLQTLLDKEQPAAICDE